MRNACNGPGSCDDQAVPGLERRPGELVLLFGIDVLAPGLVAGQLAWSLASFLRLSFPTLSCGPMKTASGISPFAPHSHAVVVELSLQKSRA